VDEEGRECRVTVSVPLNAPKLLMLELAERCAAAVDVRVTPGVQRCYVVEVRAHAGSVERQQAV
jgi:hypothetical protein